MMDSKNISSPEHDSYNREKRIDKKTGIPLKKLLPDEKPREKAVMHGIESLSDVELLALLLGSGVPGKSVIDLSREILTECDGKLSRLSRMSIAELKRKFRGVGDAKATLLVAAMAFGMRLQSSMQMEDPQLCSSRDVYNLMRSSIQNIPHEEFWVIHLNRANRLIFADRVSKGGTSATAVDPKLIAKSAIDHLTHGIILVHNHPSGTLAPSVQDKALTRKVIEVCNIIDVTVQDHLIIGTNGYYSFRDNGSL